MENEENLTDKIDGINSELVKANAFNEDAALALDLIYNFFAKNRNIFGNSGSSIPHLDMFFNENGYVPVKVLNPCCHNAEEENNNGGLPYIPKPRPNPIPETVPKPVPVPVPKPVPVPVPTPAPVPVTPPQPISEPIPLLPPTGVISTPPEPLPAPTPTDAPINMPKMDAPPDLIGSPVLPPVQEPDLKPVVPLTPVAPVLPVTPEPNQISDSFIMGDPMGTGVEGMGIDPTTPTDLSEAGPVVTAINENPYAFLAALAAAPLLGILGLPALPTLPAWVYGAGLGTAAMIPITANAEEAPPTEPPPVMNEKEKQKLNSDYSPISYSAKDGVLTDEITLKADEIKFISDVIRFKNTGTFTNQETVSSSTSQPQLASYQPPLETQPNNKGSVSENTSIASSHESMLNGNKPQDNTSFKTPSSGSGISDMVTSVSSAVSSMGKFLNDLSSKTFTNAKIPPRVNPIDPTESQPVVYESKSTGYLTAGVGEPRPAMTSLEQNIFLKSGMFEKQKKGSLLL